MTEPEHLDSEATEPAQPWPPIRCVVVSGPDPETTEPTRYDGVDVCPAPVDDDDRCLAPLPCTEHGVTDAVTGHALYGYVYVQLTPREGS